jgi:transposase-like protein
MNCPNCKSKKVIKMGSVSGLPNSPAFRCMNCDLGFIITNPKSYITEKSKMRNAVCRKL